MVNFLGPEDDQGVKVYYNGVQEGSDPSKYEYAIQVGDRKIAVGRYYTGSSWRDGSVEVDELIMFNQALTNEEIVRLTSN